MRANAPDVAVAGKLCSRCQQFLPLDAFGRNRSRANGRATYCRPCTAAYIHAWNRRNGERNHTKWIRRTHNISKQEYDALLERQAGVCAICGARPTRRRLEIDHNHDTGEIRGLLCWDCNIGLGTFRDDARRLRRAADYLGGGANA